MNGAVNKASVSPQELAAEDGDGVVETDEEREVFGDEAPADGDDADGAGGNGRRKEEDEPTLGDAGAARCRTEVKEHVEKDHAPHDGVPVRIRNAEPEQEAWNDGVDAEEIQPRLDKYHEHLTRRTEQERDRTLRVAVETEKLMPFLIMQTTCNPDDNIVKEAAPRSHNDEYNAKKCRKRNRHQNIVRYAGDDPLVMQKDEGHTEREEEDREQRPHDDEHRSLSCGYARMAQEHDLCNRAARCSRREKCEKIIAKDHLYCLVQGDFFIGDLDEVHEAAAVEEHPKPDSKKRQQQRPRMKARQILERIDVHRCIDNGGGDAHDKHKNKEKAPRKFTHALRSLLSPTSSNILHVPQRHCGCEWIPHSHMRARNMQAPAGHAG